MQQTALRSTPWSLAFALALVAGTGAWFARAERFADPAANPPLPVAARTSPEPVPGRIAVTIPAGGRVTAALYTRAGAFVRTLADEVPLPKGRTGFAWDGRDALGHAAPAGAYAVRVEVSGPRVRALRVSALAWPSPGAAR